MDGDTIPTPYGASIKVPLDLLFWGDPEVKFDVFFQVDVIIWVFSKIGVPQNGWFIVENPMNKWMIWGYHYFWKHPYITFPPKNVEI